MPEGRLLRRTNALFAQNYDKWKGIYDRVYSEMDNKSIPKCCLKYFTPFIMHKMIHKITAQTMGSQFPLVPMVKVNGLKSQAATDQSRRSSGTPRSFRIASTNKPTSKSAAEKRSFPQDG